MVSVCTCLKASSWQLFWHSDLQFYPHKQLLCRLLFRIANLGPERFGTGKSSNPISNPMCMGLFHAYLFLFFFRDNW
uniref:Uncharacterized protein n=1 Tax=Rhizophora mucronata TaxID=61149 RepID=A0A2P2KZV6_RHIMU